MKKYFSLILSFILISLSFGYSQTNALMACHTGNFNQFGNDITSLSMDDCCDFYPEYNAGCSFGIGSCKMNIECLEFMSESECNYEGGTYYSESGCTNLGTPSPACTIENGVGKFKPVYKKKWFTAGEALASDMSWVPVCDPMPSAGGECSEVMDSCKRNNTTTSYLECGRYDTGEQTCTIDLCNTGYHQEGNQCVPDAVNGVCSTDPNNMDCAAGNYIDLTDISTEYKWQCSGQNGGQNEVCSRTIPVVPENGVCSSTHYGCNIGSLVSGSDVDGTIEWNWSCRGTNGGSTASCSETKPVTVTPIVSGGDWPTSGAASSAIDDSKTSGVLGDSQYLLQWCATHSLLLPGGSPCRTIKFTDKGGIATLPKDGGIENLSLLQNDMNFEFIGEGVFTLDTYVTDKAHNISKKRFIYKVDKTAPKFDNISFVETKGDQYINIEPNTGISSTGLGVYHASKVDDSTVRPDLDNYDDAIYGPSEKSYLQSDITQIRYKENDVLGGSPTIDVIVYGTDLGTNVNYMSRSSNIEFYKGINIDENSSFYYNNDIDLVVLGPDHKTTTIETFDFSKGGINALGDNQGGQITVRLSDNAGNYSEKAFYVYRDEASPIVGDIKLNFQGDTNNLRLPGKTDSRYVLANNTTNIDYDWGTANDHMATGINMYVENINQNNIDNSNLSLSQKLSLGNDTTGTTIENINLTKIDSDLKNPAFGENYRNYEVQFRTPGITGNKICDAVGNCIDGNTVLTNFRAIANNINLNKSNLSILPPINAFAGNYRTIGATGYNLTYSLKDVYDNTIRQIFADGLQVRKHVSNIEFTNGLNQKQIDLEYTNIGLGFGSHSYSGAVIVKDGEGNNEIVNNSTNVNEIDLDNNLVLSEQNNSSNGVFESIIYSAIPTVGGYKYMKDSAILTLEKINNNITDNNSLVYNGLSNSNDKNVDYSGGANGNYYSITNNIDENVNNRYNLTNNSLTDYGKISPTNYSKNLISPSDKINFEFGSPIVYYANNFNILRDGIDSEHLKEFKTNFTGTYKMYERYFDAGVTLGNTYNLSDNNNVDFYVDIQNNPTVLDNKFMNFQEESTLANNSYNVQYQAKAGKDFEKWGYVSYIRYLVDGEWMHIPSISRGVAGNGNNLQASAYYPTGITASGGVSHLTQDIAITGLVNKADGLSNTGPQVGLAQLDLERPYTRAELLSKLKKKIFSVNKVDNWCSGNTTNLTETPTSGASACTFNINGEIISFYKGDLVIENTNTITEKRTIIVLDGRVTIKSNINTNNNGQVLLASVTNKGLENINLSNDYNNLSKQKGWIAIGQNVTNINAFLLAQGPIVSLDNSLNNDVMHTYNAPDKLLNQLHIYGSVFSLNTIGGENKNECPYIENTCDGDEAKMYDLSFLRRYALVDAGQFQGTQGVMVPYHPNLDFNSLNESISKSSGSYSYDRNGNKVESNTGLREANSNHLSAPIIVERDNRWTTSPSYFSKD